MADKKISQLTGATTPLAGTEVLPVVQGGSTVKVSVADLTAGRSISTAGASLDGSVVINDSGAIANFRVEGDTDANLIFAEASTDRVGFGVSNPSYKVTARSAIDTYTIGIRDTIGNDRLVIGPRASAPIDNFTPVQIANDNDGNLLLSSRTNNPSGVKIYRNAGTAAVLSANFDSAGNVTVNTGNLVVGTAAKGIDFSANTGAAGMTSELLNWYEEGTWTPTVSGASGTTYTTQNGWYTRIGNLVTVGFELTINAAGTITGGASIAGLPFTSAATYKSSGSLSFAGTVVTSTVWQGLVIGASQSVLTVYVKTAASASTTSINGSDFFGAGTQLIGLLTYRV